ncbi:MAG TPA: hypothetical protein VHL11_18300 [Phototrophicaceae bacterium]|jgi:hypothetical protein|nr:hypothetical protein [Phototrophicaceae bacterium]
MTIPEIPIQYLPDTSPELQAEIKTFVARHNRLDRLITSEARVLSMISQDEFTIDLVLHYQDGVYLVYDTT